MALLGRIIVILFALFMATVASGIATAIALLGTELHIVGADPIEHVFFWGTAAVASGVTVFAGFLPMLIVVILAEAFSIRSLVIQAAAGAAILLLGYYSAGLTTYEESIDHPPPPISREAEIAAAAGVVFGFIYWVIAGRNAGRWRERRAEQA